MGDVSQFKPRKKDHTVWQCGECDCQHFFLLDNYKIECRNCGGILATMFLSHEPPTKKEKQSD